LHTHNAHVHTRACTPLAGNHAIVPSFPKGSAGALVPLPVCNVDVSSYSIKEWAGLPCQLGAYCRYK